MLGDKVRDARKTKHFTLEQLAEASGLTASYISQLERNLTEPSISSLRKIAQVLQIPMYSFLDEENSQTEVIRKEKRRTLILKESGIEYEYISPLGSGSSNAQLEMAEFTLAPGKWTNDEYIRHVQSEECLCVLKGSLTVDCIDVKYILNEGDSIYLHCNTPHNVFNHTDQPTKALFCAAPPVI